VPNPERGVYDEWAREFVRSIRGERSARGLSAILGFKSDVVSRWESGAREVPAAEALRALAALGMDPWDGLVRFDAFLGKRIAEIPGDEAERLSALLRSLCDHVPTAVLSKALGVSHRSVERLLNGEFRPRLATVLLLIDLSTSRALDFMLALLQERLSPRLREVTEQRRAQQRVSVEFPLAEAVLALLRSVPYERSVGDASLWLASKLLQPPAKMQQTLDALVQRGLASRVGERYVAHATSHVDLRLADPTMETSKFWARESGRRIDHEPSPHVGFLVYGTSQANARRIYVVLRKAYQDSLEILREPAPSERVMLLSMGFYSLDGADLNLV
jgi:transcriptional regulator with XRE-family HTH domain